MQNPALLQPMIQQIAQANPGLAEYLGQNPEALLQLLGTLGGEGGFDDGEGEGGAPPGSHVVQVTPEERAAIERVRIHFGYVAFILMWSRRFMTAGSSGFPSTNCLGSLLCL